MKKSDFTDENLQKLFGHEAAEDESIERLKEYYVKTTHYEQVTADLPLRILVGHKGIGKSAMFHVAMSENEENHIINILIKPDDIIELALDDEQNFLKLINNWKKGLRQIIVMKVLESVGNYSEDIKSKIVKYTGPIISFIAETFSRGKINTEPAKQKFLENFTSSRKINVYIDDLDRGWEGKKDDIKKISALLNAVRDISKESEGINFKISLRSDVYYLVRTSDESTDKIEGSVIWFSWTNHEIYVLLIKRIESFSGREINEKELIDRNIKQEDLIKHLSPIMVDRFQGKGKWSNIPINRMLLSLIRKRPRDLVKLCTLAGRKAREYGANKIESRHFQEIFDEYSQGRLQDTINEYRSELPDIERLLLSMKPTTKEKKKNSAFIYSESELFDKLKNIISQGDFIFSNGKVAEPKQLIAFMYKINFLTARKNEESGEITRKYFEESRYISNTYTSFGFDWEIHPAYRWALHPDNQDSIYKIAL